jgi:hypothetical protein
MYADEVLAIQYRILVLYLSLACSCVKKIERVDYLSCSIYNLCRIVLAVEMDEFRKCVFYGRII